MRILAVLFSFILVEAKAQVRCAFDIGSGQTKVAAGKVGTGAASIVYREIRKIPIKASVVNGVLPSSITSQLLSVISEFKQNCQKHGAREFVGVATSGFREATVNGEAELKSVAEKTGTGLRIISGEEEGLIGLDAVVANLNIDQRKKNFVVWDIGGGSMQFSTRSQDGVLSESIPTGAGSFRTQLFNLVKHGLPLSGAELNLSDRMASVLAQQLSPKLRKSIAQNKSIVIGIGAVHSEAMAKSFTDGSTYTFNEAKVLRKAVIGLDVDKIQKTYPANTYPESLPTTVSLITSLMQALGIKEVRSMEVNLTDGLLSGSSGQGR